MVSEDESVEQEPSRGQVRNSECSHMKDKMISLSAS
jgi:hypothetical protein